MKTLQTTSRRFMLVLLTVLFFLFTAILSGCASANPKNAPLSTTVSTVEESSTTASVNEDTIVIEPTSEQSTEQSAVSSEPSADQENPAEQNSDAKDSTASGTIESPVAFGERFSWSGTYEYKKNSYSAEYSVTVHGASLITADEISDLGIKKPDEKEAIDYFMIDLLVEATDCKLISTEETSGTKYLSSWYPGIMGSETLDGLGVIGSMDYGFTGCLKDNVRGATKSEKITIGSTGSYAAQGKVILPVIREKESLMIMRNDFEKDPAKAKIFFLLK